jgi:hypothetical protein
MILNQLVFLTGQNCQLLLLAPSPRRRITDPPVEYNTRRKFIYVQTHQYNHSTMQLNHSIDFEIQPSKPQSPTKVPETLAGLAPSYLYLPTPYLHTSKLPNEAVEIQRLTAGIQDNAQILARGRSDSIFFPELSPKGWSSWSLFPEVVNRPNSCPPLPFTFPNKKVEKVTSFDCFLCSKTFSWKKRLDSHMAMHSDVRPYKCSTCLDSFKKSHHLRRHIKGCDKRMAKRGSIFFELK